MIYESWLFMRFHQSPKEPFSRLLQLDYRDHVTELLTTIGACGLTFDITINFELTKLYLEVVGDLLPVARDSIPRPCDH
jgi:hypothetical protein